MRNTCISSTTQALEILFIDAHSIFCEGLRQLIHAEFPTFHITETSTAQEGMKIIRHATFDLIFLDIHLSDIYGMDLLTDIKAAGGPTPVIVLSFYPEATYGIRALKANGAAYLCKNCQPEELYRCIRTVCLGRKYITPRLSEHLAMALGDDHHDSTELHEALSNRELEVLRLLSIGHTSTQIAHILSLSVKTISTDRSRLLEKLHLHTTGQLIRYALMSNVFESKVPRPKGGDFQNPSINFIG